MASPLRLGALVAVSVASGCAFAAPGGASDGTLDIDIAAPPGDVLHRVHCFAEQSALYLAGATYEPASRFQVRSVHVSQQ